MDAGAHGIVVPMVNSSEEAAKAVAATRYAPLGTRGVGLARAQAYGEKFEEYLEWQKNDPVVIVQIEHIDAVNNLESILSTDGVDGYIIGPYDLSCSMGLAGEFEHPDLIAAMEQIQSVAKQLNKIGGIHIVEPDTEKLKEKIIEGQKFIAYSVDIRMLDSICRNGLTSIKDYKE